MSFGCFDVYVQSVVVALALLPCLPHQRFLHADIKHYLSHITEKIYKVEFVGLRRRTLRDCIKFINFAFWIKCHFNVGIYFL